MEALNHEHEHETEEECSDLPAGNMPRTPLNHLIYADEQATALKPLSQQNLEKTTPQRPVQKRYLTGLEEEPPITINILRRALPDRFKD